MIEPKQGLKLIRKQGSQLPVTIESVGLHELWISDNNGTYFIDRSKLDDFFDIYSEPAADFIEVSLVDKKLDDPLHRSTSMEMNNPSERQVEAFKHESE